MTELERLQLIEKRYLQMCKAVEYDLPKWEHLFKIEEASKKFVEAENKALNTKEAAEYLENIDDSRRCFKQLEETLKE